MDWEKHRRKDNSINLYDAWLDAPEDVLKEKLQSIFGCNFLASVDSYQPIISRQVAAISLSVADYLQLQNKQG